MARALGPIWKAGGDRSQARADIALTPQPRMLFGAVFAGSPRWALGDYWLKLRPSGETLRPIEPDRRGGDAATPKDVSLKFALLDQPVDEPRRNAEYAAGLDQRRVRWSKRRAVVRRFKG